MNIPEAVREVIERGPLAHLTTLNPDGAPQVTVVWVGLEAEECVMGHFGVHQKIKNIRRDPRVVLSFLGDKTSENGLREYVAVHGHGRVTEGGAVPLLARLAPLYLGAGVEYPTHVDAEHRGLCYQNHANKVFRDRPLGLASKGPGDEGKFRSRNGNSDLN